MPRKKGEITVKEKSILRFIERSIASDGYPPSVREIGEAIGLKSTATVHGYINRLIKKGYIEKKDNQGRTIKLIKGSSGEERIDGYGNYSGQKEITELPIVGRITAGEPILAVENVTDVFPVSVDFIGYNESFMLVVRGESMIEAGILDGDYIIVRKQKSAINGEIVVALIGEEATVKTFYREKDFVRLQPQNSTMDPIYVTDCEILGKVVGVFRKM